MRCGLTLFFDLLTCLRFASRLPIPAFAGETAPHRLDDFARAARLMPLAGAVLGAGAAGVLGLASLLGLPPALAAPLALCALILLTGALHEDGLADCADGFGGGASRARKLDIMKDSRIGAFGALALAASFYLRAASLVLIAQQGLVLAGAVLIGAGALSRAGALIPLALLAPARSEGAALAAGRPQPATMGIAGLIGAALALAPALAGAGLERSLLAIAVCAAGGFAVAALAKRQIGGATGDVAGAAQQLGEIACYLVFAARQG